MKQINIDKSVFEKLDHKKKSKANEVFLKLYAKQRKVKNPFDETRTQSYHTTNLKPGGNIDVTD